MIRSLAATAVAVSALAVAAPASADWSKAYVLEWYEPAMYFGAAGDSTAEPGTDCPQGINPMPNWVELAIQGGMPRDRAERYLDPEIRSQGESIYNIMPNRGPGGANVYRNPEAIPDPGVYTVQGDIAYGFDLDDNPATGFLSIDRRQRGIDNAFYKASGCILRFRGPPKKSASFMYSMEDMYNGRYTVVMVLSGAGADPRNDAEAQLAIYRAKDKVVRDPNGMGVTRDYSYRVDPDVRFQSLLDVKVTNGVIETRRPQTITMRDFWAPAFYPEELLLEQARLRFEMQPDGTLTGLFGGYRDWREHFRGTAGNGRDGSGAIHESLGQFQLPAWWYAMKRYADGMPDPVTGEMRGISTVYSITAEPAFVVSPDANEQVTVAKLFRPEPETRASVEAGTQAQR